MLCIDKIRIYNKIINVKLKTGEYQDWWNENGTFNYVNEENEYCYTIYVKYHKIWINWDFIRNIFNYPTQNDYNFFIRTINRYYNLNLTLKENNVFYRPLNEL